MNTKYKKWAFTAISCFFVWVANAQVEEFSQFYHKDMGLNPALTGLHHNKWKVNELYRYQRVGQDALMQYNYLGFDMPIKFISTWENYGVRVDTEKKSRMGIGIYDERKYHRLGYTDTNDLHHAWSAEYLSLSLQKSMFKEGVLSLGIQPGFWRNDTSTVLDANVGVLVGFGKVNCWEDDQLYKTQIGLSAYHVLGKILSKKDTAGLTIVEPRYQAHAGVLIPLSDNVGIYPNAQAIYMEKEDIYYNAGIIVYLLNHHRFKDRLRVGMHYRSTEHLEFMTGIRLFPDKETCWVYELAFSYDMALEKEDSEKNIYPVYRNAWDLNLIIYPFKKCWSLNSCIEKQ